MSPIRAPIPPPMRPMPTRCRRNSRAGSCRARWRRTADLSRADMRASFAKLKDLVGGIEQAAHPGARRHRWRGLRADPRIAALYRGRPVGGGRARDRHDQPGHGLWHGGQDGLAGEGKACRTRADRWRPVEGHHRSAPGRTGDARRQADEGSRSCAPRSEFPARPNADRYGQFARAPGQACARMRSSRVSLDALPNGGAFRSDHPRS